MYVCVRACVCACARKPMMPGSCRRQFLVNIALVKTFRTTCNKVFTRNMSSALWAKVKDATNNARKKMAIFSFETNSELIEDHGVQFNISVSTALAKKPHNLPPVPATDAPVTTDIKLQNNTIITTTSTGGVTSKTATINTSATPTNVIAASATIASVAPIGKVAFNPFLPYDPDMFVSEINNTHNLLLNKYNVVDYHMVLATKDFQPQTDPLNETDLAALWSIIHSMKFLGFFNGGPLSGASQPHKHMQLLPPVSDADRPSFEAPVEKLIKQVTVTQGEIFRIPELDFKHSCILLEDKKLAEPKPETYLYLVYKQLLSSQGLLDCAPGTKSYNFMLTSRWVLVVPRSAEKYGSILVVNSIGFLGSILVKSPEDLQILKETGPMTILKHVTFANDPKL